MTASVSDSTCTHPLERHPFENWFGFHARWCRSEGAVEGFCWFPSAAEALQWLRASIAEWSRDWNVDDGAILVESICETLGNTTVLENLPMGAINRVAPDLLRINWAGDFDALIGGDQAFARHVQRDFYANEYGDERGHGPDGTHLEDFVDHLRHYQRCVGGEAPA